MYHVLRPGGLIIVSCPSKNYDADQIIKESCELIRIKKGFWNKKRANEVETRKYEKNLE